MCIAMNSRGMTGKVERHVAFVAVAEVGHRVLGPLVGLGEQHAVAVLGVELAAQLLQEGVGLGQVLAVGALALVEVRHGVEPQAVDAHLEPEVEGGEGRLLDRGVVEVEIGLVASRSGASSRRPATGSQVQFEGSKSLKMMRASVYCRRVAPDVEVPGSRCPAGPAARAGTRDAGRRCG